MLIGGELKNLPRADEIAAARLVFPVVHGHNKASTTVVVTLLDAPCQAGAPSDFKYLGAVVGFIVPRQPESGDYCPPQPFAIEITRPLRRIARGEAAFPGFALKVVQDRAVDAGYIVRIDLPAAALVQVELDLSERE